MQQQQQKKKICRENIMVLAPDTIIAPMQYFFVSGRVNFLKDYDIFPT